MTFIESFILAFAMAIDALIVSFSYGLILKENRVRNALKFACAFGFFQFFMPVAGWLLTGLVYSYVKPYSKYIVFIVFLIIGLKFIKESFSQNKPEVNCISLSCLIFLATATSIDALGAGVSLRFLNTSLIFNAVLIGIITFIMSYSGFVAASQLKKIPSAYAEITGGMLLLYLAVKAII